MKINSSRKSLKINSCRLNHIISEQYGNFYAPRKFSGEHIVVALSVRPSVRQSGQTDGHLLGTKIPNKCPSVRTSVRPSVLPSVRPIRVRPITLLFEVGYWNYFKEMTTMLRRRVARKILVATLEVKVTAWPCSKIVSGK